MNIEMEPEALGLSSAALDRIVTHFSSYVSSGQLSGFLFTVARRGSLVYVGMGGHADREESRQVTSDTLWRIYSMTKPLTSLAAMMLYEEGCFDLSDPASKWIPELKEARVYVGGPAQSPRTIPATEPVRVHHLLSHTSGLTYGFTHLHPVDEMYRHKGYDFGYAKGADLSQAVSDWCSMPLLFQPGTAWNYSVATDVIGRLIELWSGKRLDDFFQSRILGPLGMTDTSWYCPPEKLGRLAMLYVPSKGKAVPYPEIAIGATHPPQFLAGGGGLVSSASDYQTFMTMLLEGGELGGHRFVTRRTLALMIKNHLPGGGDLRSVARDSFSETDQSGIGFGLGFSVAVDQVANRSLLSEGSFGWGGAASTAFWVDPKEELTVGFYTQLLPSNTYPIRRELQQLVYSSLLE